ncbi:MAG TPA: glycosyltransferase family 39 protein [Terriglobales bacterium]|nr:glycosyltransferase family 39 protein [Terriglobales bacterium]
MPSNSTSKAVANSALSNPIARPFMDWLLLAGFCGFLFFFGLSYFGLLGADEPRYAQVAREMLARHDWITPTLGGQAWLEKPVLYYWQTMLAYDAFGVSDWAARLSSAVDATLLVAGVYLFLRRFRPGFHLDGALMTASAAGVMGFARAAAVDMPLAAMFAIAMLSWYAWYESSSQRYLAGFHIFLALATLAKGPVAICFAVVIITVFAVAKGDYRLIRRTLWIPGVVLFCLVALPWYVAVQVRNLEFWRVFILEHNLQRFGRDLYHHTGPFWYYLPVVLLGLVPWTIFVIASVVESVRVWWTEGREMFRSEDALPAFLTIWLAVPVVFFSFSASKLPGYVVPSLPAGTLLLAEYVRRHVVDEDRPPRLLIVLHSVAAALLVAGALMMPYIVLQHHLPWDRTMAFSGGFALILAIAMAMSLRGRLGLRVLRFVSLVPVVLVVATVLRMGAPVLDATLSARPVAQEVTRVDNGSLPLAILRLSRETEYGLQFYRNQNVVRYEAGQVPTGEHLLVAPGGSQKNIAKWTSGRRVTYLGSFAAQGLDYYWVAGKSN